MPALVSVLCSPPLTTWPTMRRHCARAWSLLLVAVVQLGLLGCASPTTQRPIRLTFPSSGVGAEAEILRQQLQQYMDDHPDVHIETIVTPDAADDRHQLYVQWLNAGVSDPDVLQLDVVWTPEFATAGWLLPFEHSQDADLFPNVAEAGTFDGKIYGMPWFVDVGMLYWRTDLMTRPPSSLDQLRQRADTLVRSGRVEIGLAWHAARYEGLITVFLEILGGMGGELSGRRTSFEVATPEAVEALQWMHAAVQEWRIAPRDTLTWHEEQARFAFQTGRAAFMRNWPYAYGLLAESGNSQVAGKFAVAPMPAGPGGYPTAALGGSQLAINAHTEHPRAAEKLIRWLLQPEQMLQRVRVTGQLPPRPSLYTPARWPNHSPIPADEAREIIEHAVSRPATPIYSELSQILQVHLHRALAGQVAPAAALQSAQRQVDETAEGFDRGEGVRLPAWSWTVFGGAVVSALIVIAIGIRRGAKSSSRSQLRLALPYVGPALSIILFLAIFPVAWTVLESFLAHDLRVPEQGRVLVGLRNYVELLGSVRFWQAMAHTAFFAAVSVCLELVLGMAIALGVDRVVRARGIVRSAVLLPWAVPTVVAGLLWRFLFEGDTSLANAVVTSTGLQLEPIAWFAHSTLAWVPLVLADVWKTTPFVVILLLAGLQTIDQNLHRAASVDGASAWQRFWHVTMPLLRGPLLVVVLFRTMDAFRVFGLVYVLTGGGPGTATEPIALYTFDVLLQDLRFGLGAAASVAIFVVMLALALACLGAMRLPSAEEEP